MKKLIGLLILSFGLVHFSQAATKYVSPSGNNTTGDSWATAWNELDQIKWANVNFGDTVLIGQGTYRKPFIYNKASAGGSATNRILVQKTTESTQNGNVIFDFRGQPTPPYIPGGHQSGLWTAYIQILAPYLTFDGIDKRKFSIYCSASNTFWIQTAMNNDVFTIKNVFVDGGTPTNQSQRPFWIASGSVHIDKSELYRHQGSEDMISFKSTGTDADLTITNSYIHAWQSMGGSHSDMIEGCGPSICTMGDLTLRNNLIDDGLPSGGKNVVVMTGYTHWQTVEISNNVFKDTYQIFQPESVQTMKAFNNTFYNTADANFGGVNNIYDSNTQVVWNSATYSMWDPRTPSFITHDTNFKGSAGFQNPSSIVGADGIPFTADDGFRLTAGSSAINKGTAVTGRTTDIMGNSISGANDLGAYEYGGSVPPPSTPHPADANSDFLMALNEATSFAACWKTNCNANATLDNAVRAGTLWNATFNGQYQYNSGAACPICWEIKP